MAERRDSVPVERRYVYKDQKKLRRGYTTGTCSAAAARAAAWMLLSGQAVEQVHITTPAGIPLALIPEEVVLEKDRVSCGIRKDGGDDADVTDGILIFAEVKRKEEAGVSITGGRGIGKVTAKGLEQEPGSYAINRVPRHMIREAVEEVMEIHGYEGGLLVTISAPEGEALADRTFNPHLGIEGGISILGTSGIVEPMSEQALVDTIALELSMQAAAGRSCCMMTPGNYGMQFLSGVLQLDPGLAVKCSNFIGDTIDMAPAYGMKGLLLVGHLGKLVKLGAGIMNTHSRYGDGRMEVLCACALEAGAERKLLKALLECVTTDGAVSLLREAGLDGPALGILMKKIEYHLKRRVYPGICIGALVFSNVHGLLGQTEDVPRLLAWVREEMKMPGREFETG